MKIFVILFTFSVCARCGYGQDLPLFGPLPKVPKEWSLRESSGFGEPKWRWSWIVLTNSQNGDVLSFAAHKSGSGEPRELIFWSDTAHEIFQGGLPVWTVKNGFGRWPIRNSVVN